MNRKRLLHFFILFFLSILFQNCASTLTTEVNNQILVQSQIDLVDIKEDQVKVKLDIKGILTDSILFSFPKVVPGTYQFNDYGQFITDFNAVDVNGNTLTSKKYNTNQWSIQNASQLSSITYKVNDTYDSEKEHNVFSPAGTNIENGKNFVLNLQGFIGYFTGENDTSYKVLIKRPSIVKPSTSSTALFNEQKSKQAYYYTDLFVYDTYAELVDSPIMYNDSDFASFQVDEMDISLSIYSPRGKHSSNYFIPALKRMIIAQKNFLGSIKSTDKYTILVYLSSSKSDDAQGFGALEHNTSTLVVMPESISKQQLENKLMDIISHEFFHIVTPLHLHSEEIHNFDYEQPKMSKHLWLYEGTTEYFSQLFQVRQALLDKNQFYENLLQKIQNSKLYDDNLLFTELSENILHAPYHQNYRNVYEKGALIAMCLDIIIREKSNGLTGLIDLIESLSIRYGKERPFKDETLFEVIKEVSYPEVYDFLKKHVEGNVSIDYAFYFKKVGLDYEKIKVESDYFIYEQQPFITVDSSNEYIVFTKETRKNDFLTDLGILPGDELLAINNKRYAGNNIYDLFKDAKKWRKNDSLTFSLRRNKKNIELKTKVTDATVSIFTLKESSDPEKNEVALRKSWINE